MVANDLFNIFINGSRTGKRFEPHKVQCSRICAIPVESWGTVFKCILKALVLSAGFSKWSHCASQNLCFKWTAFSKFNSGTEVALTTVHPCGRLSWALYLDTFGNADKFLWLDSFWHSFGMRFMINNWKLSKSHENSNIYIIAFVYFHVENERSTRSTLQAFRFIWDVEKVEIQLIWLKKENLFSVKKRLANLFFKKENWLKHH